GLADEHGRFVTTLTVYALLMWYLLEVRKLRSPVVKTVNMTSMVDRLGEKYGVPVYEVPVGFKYIGPKMQETGAMMGGEESGGFGFAMHLPERDGIVADLFLLDFLLKTKKKPSELIAELMRIAGPSHYLRRDLHFEGAAYGSAKTRIMAALHEAAPEKLGGHAVAKIVQLDTKDGTKFFLDDGSWLLIRLSGTEPLVRVYAETKSQGELAPLLDAGERMVPMTVHRDYGLPGYVGRDSLVIASSYSGNTEETLSAFEEARRRGAKVLALTTGGKLAELARASGYPVVTFSYKARPRATLGYSLGLVLGALFRMGFVRDLSADIEVALKDLSRIEERVHEGGRTNDAKKLAQELFARIMVAYGAGAM